MVRLSPHDSAVLSRLVQFGSLSEQKRQAIFDELESAEARRVGEAVFDPKKYSTSSALVRATVDRFRKWSEANRRIGERRTVRFRTARVRRGLLTQSDEMNHSLGAQSALRATVPTPKA